MRSCSLIASIATIDALVLSIMLCYDLALDYGR